MRGLGIVMLAAAIAGCSCYRSADEETGNAAASSQVAAATQTPDAATTDNTPARPASNATPDDAVTRADFAKASATVQRYLGALPGAARGDADALWSGGRPAPVPDDAALRGIGNIQSIRINNDAPIALDQEQPPRRIEVPVQLIVRTDTGTQRLVGAYRLQPRSGSDDWEIYSATLHPVLR
ncbi:hypothetical protein [Xanthomonas campestris]|uniref:hypothetical protein n=1 Tax=Xanthomonas campestris TaxID=339 RepID=UPI002B1CE1D1|nr:hypothetical protein [Xanthomonas campestris]